MKEEFKVPSGKVLDKLNRLGSLGVAGIGVALGVGESEAVGVDTTNSLPKIPPAKIETAVFKFDLSSTNDLILKLNRDMNEALATGKTSQTNISSTKPEQAQGGLIIDELQNNLGASMKIKNPSLFSDVSYYRAFLLNADQVRRKLLAIDAKTKVPPESRVTWNQEMRETRRLLDLLKKEAERFGEDLQREIATLKGSALSQSSQSQIELKTRLADTLSKVVGEFNEVDDAFRALIFPHSQILQSKPVVGDEYGGEKLQSAREEMDAIAQLMQLSQEDKHKLAPVKARLAVRGLTGVIEKMYTGVATSQQGLITLKAEYGRWKSQFSEYSGLSGDKLSAILEKPYHERGINEPYVTYERPIDEVTDNKAQAMKEGLDDTVGSVAKSIVWLKDSLSAIVEKVKKLFD